MEQKQGQDEEDQIQVISDNVKTETTTVPIDGLRFALENDIIMENVINSMDLEDLDHWFEFCKKFQFHDLANMDRICWKKRSQKLAEAYYIEPLTQSIEDRAIEHITNKSLLVMTLLVMSLLEITSNDYY